VRKIFSIIVALGLVLGLLMMAAPTAAQVCEEEVMAEVSVDPPCACADAAYNITFNTSASLTEGFNHVCVKFPAGTTIPAAFDDGDILVGLSSGAGDPVFGSEVTVTGTQVCFLVPEDITAGEILVQFTLNAGIENPCTPDDYVLTVWTDRAPDSTPLEGEYTIVPAYTTFGFLYDFSATYPGVAFGFVPPMKACGQNDTGQAYNTTFNVTGTGGWFDQFVLYFMPLVEGCAAPCATAKVWFELVSIPAGEVIDLQLNGVNYTLNVCNVTKNVGKYDSTTDWYINSALALTYNTTTGWPGFIHFSSPGSYELRVYAECPKTACNPGGIIATGAQVFTAYQEKEAYKLELCEKWNLISLPLVPLGSTGSIPIETALASISNSAGGGSLRSQITAIWYYDAFAPAWKHWVPGGGAANTLTTLQDGKAYWLYVNYPLATVTKGKHTDCCGITWWVWGTKKPVPYNPPSAYPVNVGWNMVGFTSTNTTMHPSDYLWNWSAPNPVVYGYSDGCWNVQTWDLVNFTSGLLVPGEGYWIAFAKAGTVYVP
jgi:hypothetical protein